MGTETQLVKVEHLYKEFDENTKVLEDINLTINKNEVIAILGPSGTGKSTLLRCLNYLTVPTKGKITIGDVTVDAQNHTKKDVIELRKHSSMVFQGYNLFKNKTALENVMEALTVVQKKSKAEAEKHRSDCKIRQRDGFRIGRPVVLQRVYRREKVTRRFYQFSGNRRMGEVAIEPNF